MNIKRVDDVNKSDFCIAVKCSKEDGEEILVGIAEGTGVNLLEEDEANGYVDYIYYEQYGMESFEESDGGMLLKKELLRDSYGELSETIPEVLEMAYGSRDVEYIRLKAA